MPFNRVIERLDIIQQLSDLPNEDDNLSADELKARFDKGVNILKEYVFSFLDELEGKEASDKIGYNGAHPTIGEALKALESAGVGTIPPDNTITTAKLQEGSVTELKLATELINKINATKIQFGEIKPTYTGDTTTDNGASGYVTVDKWQEFELGFAPSVVFLFKHGEISSRGIEAGTATKMYPFGFKTGERALASTSSFDRSDYEQYGGIATVDKLCKCNELHEVFKIDGTKLKTHRYEYVNTDNKNVDRYDIGTTDTLCYIAIA